MMKISKNRWIILTAIIFFVSIASVVYLRSVRTAEITVPKDIPEESDETYIQKQEAKPVISGCILDILNKPTLTPDPDISVKMSSGMRTVLCLDERNPKLGNPLTLKFLVQPLINAPNTTIVVELPEWVYLLDGDTSWIGDLQAGEARVHQLVIKIDELPEPISVKSIKDYPKLAIIKATAESGNFGEPFGQGQYLFLRATDDGYIEISDKPFIIDPTINWQYETKLDNKSVNLTQIRTDMPNQGKEKKILEFGCTSLTPTPEEYDPSKLYKMRPRARTVLCLDEKNPKLGEPLTIKFLVFPVKDAPNTTVNIELPREATLLEGDLIWNGGLFNKLYLHQLTIRIDDLPEPIPVRSFDDYSKLAAIKATTLSVSPFGEKFSEYHYIFLRATSDGAIETSDKPFVSAPVTTNLGTFEPSVKGSSQ